MNTTKWYVGQRVRLMRDINISPTSKPKPLYTSDEGEVVSLDGRMGVRFDRYQTVVFVTEIYADNFVSVLDFCEPVDEFS